MCYVFVLWLRRIAYNGEIPKEDLTIIQDRSKKYKQDSNRGTKGMKNALKMGKKNKEMWHTHNNNKLVL